MYSEIAKKQNNIHVRYFPCYWFWRSISKSDERHDSRN